MTLSKIESKLELAMLAKLLFIVGGLVLILGGLLQVADIRTINDLTPSLRNISSLTSISAGIVTLLIGVLALIGSNKASVPTWNILLLILGLFVGGLGGTLVFIASVIGLIEIYVRA